MGLGTALKLGIPLGLLLAFASLWWWGSDWKTKAKNRLDEINAIVAVTQVATGDKKVTRKNVQEKITKFGEKHRRIVIKLEQQNESIDAMAREAVRLKSENSRLRKIEEKARAQRLAIINGLRISAKTPSQREDLKGQLQRVEDALDILYEESLRRSTETVQ